MHYCFLCSDADLDALASEMGLTAGMSTEGGKPITEASVESQQTSGRISEKLTLSKMDEKGSCLG